MNYERNNTLEKEVYLNSSSSVVKVKTENHLSNMARRYEQAFKTVYNRLPEWRKKEVDNYTRGDTLPLLSHEKDFARQVAALAESQ